MTRSIRLGLVVGLLALAGCGDDDGDDDSNLTCGAGTVEMAGMCVPESSTTCGAGTVEVEGECVPESSTTCGAGTHPEGDECVPDDPDAAGPAAPTGLAATVNGADVDLTWTSPADADLAGVVLVRRVHDAVLRAPAPGTTYAAGDALGPGDEVIFAGTGTSFTDEDAPVGLVHYALFAADAAPNYSAPARARALVPVPAQTAQLSIALGPPAVVTVTQPSAYRITAFAQLNGTTDELRISLSVESDVARVAFNPKLVIDAVTEGTVDNADGTRQGKPFLKLAPHAVDFQGIAARTLELSGIDGDPATIVVDLSIVESPMLIRNRAVTTQVAFSLHDLDTFTTVRDIGCAELPRVLGSKDACAVRMGALSATGRLLYLGLRNDPAVLVFDMVTLQPIAFVPVASGKGNIDAIAIDPGGSALYAVLNEGAHVGRGAMTQYGGPDDVEVGLVRLDASSLAETGRIVLVPAAAGQEELRGRGPFLSRDGALAVVLLDGAGAARLIDLAAFAEIDTDAATAGVQPIDLSATSDFPHRAAFSADRATLYVGYGGGGTSTNWTKVINAVALDDFTLSTVEFSVDITDAAAPALAVAPNGDVWVGRKFPDGGDGKLVSVFDAALSAETRIDVGTLGVDAIAFSPDGARAFVSMQNAAQALVVIDTATKERIDTDGDGGNGVTDALAEGTGQQQMFVTPF